MITDCAAERLLTTAITKSVLYTGAQDYILAKNGYHVESFNHTMNIFHDRRIAFGNEQYNTKSKLAVCHWNEGVDREYTSMWHPKHDPRAPRQQKGKKILTKCTYKYCDSIRKRYVRKVYGKKEEEYHAFEWLVSSVLLPFYFTNTTSNSIYTRLQTVQ